MNGGRISHSLPDHIDAEADVVVIGAGACGLVAALRARAAGAEVMVLERDASPSGSTSMSSGFVPAPATRFQRAIGVADDTPERFEADIMSKSKGKSAASLTRLATRPSARRSDGWLMRTDLSGSCWMISSIPAIPGTGCTRFPKRPAAALEARLLAAVEAAEIPVVTEAHVTALYADAEDRITAVEITRPDGVREVLGCKALVLACNGFGGNAALVREHIPEIADGLYYGHQGNTGDALVWGESLGVRVDHLSGYQGHGSLAHPHGILISWALMMEGGIQVNADGVRFSNEHGGYSEQAVNVLAQPGGIAWNIYDARLHAFAQGFPDYQEAMVAGAVREAADVGELARVTGLPEAALAKTLAEVANYQSGKFGDPFGRDFSDKPALAAPFFAVRVTGALFHTQGGLMIDDQARVVRDGGAPFANLFAGGGAACGVSGPDVSGYLSGNGLLTAIGFGFVAGEAAGTLTSTNGS